MAVPGLIGLPPPGIMAGGMLMRLSQDEARAIRACADRHFGRRATVRLFGSRVDDARRGGDIDLHVEAESPDQATLEAEIAFRLDLQDHIGEQKVDVILRRPGYEPRTIDRIALRTGLELRAVTTPAVIG